MYRLIALYFTIFVIRQRTHPALRAPLRWRGLYAQVEENLLRWGGALRSGLRKPPLLERALRSTRRKSPLREGTLRSGRRKPPPLEGALCSTRRKPPPLEGALRSARRKSLPRVRCNKLCLPFIYPQHLVFR